MIDVRDNRNVAYIFTSINRSLSHESVIREEWNIVKAKAFRSDAKRQYSKAETTSIL